MALLVTLCALAAVAVLFLILIYVVIQGLPALSVQFFTEREYAPVIGAAASRGGIGPAIQGTLIMLAAGSLIGLPIGIFTAVYLSEFGRGWFASAVRFVVDILAGFPSVVIGVFVWTAIVRPKLVTQGFSGLAGAVALAIIMIPIVTKTVEEILRLVPDALREASLAMGVPRWRTILFVVMPVARNGIITGSILALARAGGETAPLLLTAGGNRFFNANLLDPMASMPVYIYQYTFSPYAVFNLRAWGTALVLIVAIALLGLAVRVATRGRGLR